MNNPILTNTLFSCKTSYLIPLFDTCAYPWEMLPQIGEYLRRLISDGYPGVREVAKGVFAGENVSIAATAVFEGVVFLGAGTQVRPGAYLRGNVITGESCVLGNSSEFKNCILLDFVQAPHYNYVGDSVLGNHAHLGAGTVCSNLRTDGNPVVIHGERNYATGLRKVGAFLGDGADVGCSCVLNPGTVLGKDTSVYPNTSLRGVFPAGRIIKSQDNVVIRRESDN